MKLNQLGLTPTGQKATKKLTSQVHKTTVAAAMEPKLRLGVIGIEIGQEQSTGATSLVEGAQDLGAVATTLIKAARALNFDKKLPSASSSDVWQGAMMLEQLRLKSHDHYQAAFDLMHSMPAVVRSNVNTKTCEELLDVIKLPGIITEAATAVVNLAKLHPQVLVYIGNVMRIIELLDHLDNIARTSEDDLDAKMAKAALLKTEVLLKAGIKT